MKFKPSYWYYFIFALCFAGFQFLEDSIRKNYIGTSELVTYVLGFIPNFLPAIGIPCLLYAALPHLVGKSRTQFIAPKAHIYALIVSQFGLISWECAQLLLDGGTFDMHDILWTIIGGVAFYSIWYLHSARYGDVAKFT
ncbi:hypothetical protein [Alteromonas hispanica]|uniref:Uncharacterized protein n=1 Tax=Alteromonas hispanica TaxID=315421 RepID=A0A6L9MX77_9ALTE|nr:hypothetical protein [Alteromonas hispanica]NDW22270.1 hypothetical protein [Alteromonas hispanica]